MVFFFSPFSQAASVATLPSALLVEQFLLGASWVFLVQLGAAISLSTSASLCERSLGLD